MAATKIPIAPDSAAELHGLIGDDATATFESDPEFIDSDPTGNASSEHIEVQRDTDDTEDSEEEEEELQEEEEEEEDEEGEEGDLDDEDEEEDDDEEDVGAAASRAAESTKLRGPVVNGNASVESTLEEDDDAGDEGADEDAVGSDSPKTARVVDAALRMNSLVAVASEYAANA